MKLSIEENLMYNVMNAIYDSGIPIDFKGSMVLKVCLMERGYSEEIRHTVDIDGNWYSEEMPTKENIENSLNKALRNKNINLKAEIYRMYGEGKSAGINLIDKDTKEIIFTMDIDVNRPKTQVKKYEINNIVFNGVSPIQMIADKVSVVSSKKVFRRIKDVIDLYYLSQVFDFNRDDIIKTLEQNNRALGDFYDFLNNEEDLRHSFEKFRFEGDINKPLFNDVYNGVKEYIKEILPSNHINIEHKEVNDKEDVGYEI